MAPLTQSTYRLNDSPEAFDRNLRVLGIRAKGDLVNIALRPFYLIKSAARYAPGEAQMRAFIYEVSRYYHKNPYHNFHHAVDTTNVMGWLLTRPMVVRKLPPLHAYILLIAALAHDLDHPGTDNQWEVKTHSPWIKRYGKTSVLERRSSDLTRWLLTERCPAVVGKFSPRERDEGLKLLDSVILATDFSFHGQFLEELESQLDRGGIDADDPAGQSLLSRALIKAADISNTAREFHVARLWGRRIMREYWAQGGREIRRNLPVGPMNDPEKVNFPVAQGWFIESQALKLFELLARVEPEVQQTVDSLRVNLQRYREAARHQGTS